MPHRSRSLSVASLVLSIACGGATRPVATSHPGPAAATTTQSPTSTSFDFAVIGDLPYSTDDETRKLPNLVADLNSYKTLRFVVHVGDIKPSKGAPCTEQLFADRHRQFETIRA